MQGIRWAVAVTTAPRRECTLAACVESLLTCGWDPVVFAEPGSTKLPGTTRVIEHPQKMGVWKNWVASIRWCLSNTDADAIMTVQDDSLFHPESKAYAERAMWPREDAAFISLYTPMHYSIRRKKYRSDANDWRPVGINRIHTKSLWGACALVWPREVLESVAKHRLIEEWKGAVPGKKHGELRSSLLERRAAFNAKREADPSLIANSDTAIGKICNRMKRSMWFVDPSPVQHIARFSAIGHGGNQGKRNAIRIADHSLPLEYQAPIQNIVDLQLDQPDDN